MIMSKVHVQYSNKRARRQPAKILARLIQAMRRDSDAPFLVLIGGPGGSGKSTIAGKIQTQLKDAAILALDDYKTPRSLRKAQKIFGPHPRANEMAMIKKHLACLKNGRSFDKPVYNRRLGRISRFQKFSPRPITLIEGEVATYQPFRKSAHLTLFVDAHWNTLLTARLIRDIGQRGYDTDQTITTFLHSNLREFRRYGAHSKRHADIHIYCDEDFHFFIESIEQRLFDTYHDVFALDLGPIDPTASPLDIPLPLHDDLTLDLKIYDEYLNALFHRGIHRIMVGHFCAEQAALTLQEKKILLQSACEFFPGEIFSYIPAGNLDETQRLIAGAREYGSDHILVDLSFLPPKTPAEGRHRYQQALYDQGPVTFLKPGHRFRLSRNPMAAKHRAQTVIKDFPMAVRPPF